VKLGAYLEIARVDHWFKNVFAFPGIVLALHTDPSLVGPSLAVSLGAAMLGLCLTASSNYVINEYLDAETDRKHPTKKNRPAARGDVTLGGVLVEWLLLAVAGIGLGFWVAPGAGWTLLVLWLMGIAYNVRPLRTKEHPYLDVTSEAVNNPLRLLLGWYATQSTLIPPASLLLSYWMLGSYLMAVKRYAELRSIGDRDRAAAYRRSFAWYTEERLLVSAMAYASACALFAGMFIIRYRIELVLSVPFVAAFFAMYLRVGMDDDSAAMKPEHLYKHRPLLALSVVTFVVCLALMSVDFEFLDPLFAPTIPAE